MQEQEEREYEISFLGRDEEAAKTVARALAAGGCAVTVEGPVERTELAYEIGGVSVAHFGFFHFRGMPTAAVSVERALSTEKGILRTLMVTPPVVREKPRMPFEGRPERPAQFEGSSSPSSSPASPASPAMPLSNEALEKRIEEISR